MFWRQCWVTPRGVEAPKPGWLVGRTISARLQSGGRLWSRMAPEKIVLAEVTSGIALG